MKTVPSLRDSKSELRKQIRRLRAGLDDTRRRALDAAINRHLLELAERLKPRVIAAYQAFDGEPDLAPALQELRRRGACLALPVVHSEPGRAAISFRDWPADAEMCDNGFGIREPIDTRDVPVDELDLVLVPLVAWDADGGRLGMGASFYDRLFQPFARLDRPRRVGVGYRLQQLEQVPLEPWDIRLHLVLTDDGCIECGAGAAEPR